MRQRESLNRTHTGLVTAAHGRHYVVELADGDLLHCFPRGKKHSYACGDIVDVERAGDKQGKIKKLNPRTSLLYRSDRYRKKIIAANITQAVIVVAAKPAFNEDLLLRCLVACEQQHIAALIALNKTDLVEETAKAAIALALYRELGYALVPLSARNDVSPLRSALQGHRSVLVGQSGMGKSTIVNALLPDVQVRTAEISEALGTGKHTTTSAQLYCLDGETSIIDSPGLQTFGLLHLTHAELVDCFPEFKPFLGRCRFDDCRHTVEPGCAVISAVNHNRPDKDGQKINRTDARRIGANGVDKRRWLAYRELVAELDAKPPEWA